MSAPPHQPRARSSGPRCRRCLPRPPAPAATAGRPFGSARRLHPRDVAVAERLKRSATATSSGAPTHRDPRTCAARRSCCRARRPSPRRGGITRRYRMAEQRAVCAAVPVRALLQLPLLGVERGYKGLYGGGWPLRGMGAAGTALGAADARTNEHYEIGTILTQFLHCGSTSARRRVGLVIADRHHTVRCVTFDCAAMARNSHP